MTETCTHLDHIAAVAPSGTGCVECLLTGMHWVHLRRCTECGHIGCCDSRRASTRPRTSTTIAHPIIQSYEPGEDWYYCYVDDLAFEIDGRGPEPVTPLTAAGRLRLRPRTSPAEAGSTGSCRGRVARDRRPSA